MGTGEGHKDDTPVSDVLLPNYTIATLYSVIDTLVGSQRTPLTSFREKIRWHNVDDGRSYFAGDFIFCLGKGSKRRKVIVGGYHQFVNIEMSPTDKVA